MTTDALGRAPAPGDTRTFVAAANAEETHVLLRRAVLIRHGETEWTLSGQHTRVTRARSDASAALGRYSPEKENASAAV
jgi:hypothetical protein